MLDTFQNVFCCIQQLHLTEDILKCIEQINNAVLIATPLTVYLYSTPECSTPGLPLMSLNIPVSLFGPLSPYMCPYMYPCVPIDGPM